MCVPQKAAAAMGGFGPLALCTRVSNTLTLTNPATLRSVQMDVRLMAAEGCCAEKSCARESGQELRISVLMPYEQMHVLLQRLKFFRPDC